MNIKKDYLFYAVIIFLLISAPVIIILFEASPKQSAVKKPAPKITANTPKPKASMEVSSTELKSLNNGKKEWQLVADKIYINETTRVGEAKNIKCEFYGEDGKLYVYLNSRGAKINLNTNDMDFVGPVKAKTVKNEFFEAEKLKYLGKDKLLIGSGLVKLTKGNSVIYGKRLIGNPAKRTVEIKESVKATIKLKDF